MSRSAPRSDLATHVVENQPPIRALPNWGYEQSAESMLGVGALVIDVGTGEMKCRTC